LHLAPWTGHLFLVPMSVLSPPVLAALVLTVLACAPTTAPTPPPRETVLVLNGGQRSLSLLPVDSGFPVATSLGDTAGTPLDVAAREQVALVAGGDANQVQVVDIVAGHVLRTIPLAPGSGVSSVDIINDSLAYVTNPGLNTVTRVNYRTGDTASVAVGQYPRAAALARGRLFVLNANVERCVPPAAGLCVKGPSWLTVIDPIANTHAAGRDSVALPSPGNGSAIELGGDGLLYVINAGDGEEVPGRLSIVDPISREEVGSFGGFGVLPNRLASDGRERLFVTSPRDGLMEFNTRTRRVVRGAGSGIPVQDPVAVVVDDEARVYVVEAGGCDTGQPGRIRIFRPDLTEIRSRLVGLCPTAATIVKIPVV